MTLTKREYEMLQRIGMLEAQNERLSKIERLANRYRDCQNEFPNDEDACAEWAEALDAALEGAPFGPDVPGYAPPPAGQVAGQESET